MRQEDNSTRIIIAVVGIIPFAILLMMTSCTTTKYVTVPEYHTDTLKVIQNVHDSIHVHDSITITATGDTVFMERWHTKYIESIKHDTIYQSRVDSVRVPDPVEVIKEVEKPLTWWQRTKMYAGMVLITLLLGSAIFGLFKVLLKFGIL